MKRYLGMALALGLVCLAGMGQEKQAANAGDRDWWKHAVFYEIYPRSYADSNGDGIGDLKGITRHLDYLQELGVDAIWLTPFFPSPLVDFGYDVSDYNNIDPVYGNLGDFAELAKEAKKRNIRIILDFVVNHTSDQHPWFVDSRSSRTAAKRDWYIWRDGAGPGKSPNNWTSTFGSPAWKYDPATQQYYYHYFYPEQPELNWRNPAVEKAMFDVTRFWYERGAAGFRLDAVDTIFEDPDLKNNPVTAGVDRFGRPNMEEIYNKNLPELHGVLQRLRSVADEYNAVLIGETWTSDVGALEKYYGENGNELQMPMDLLLTTLPMNAQVYRKHIAGVDAASDWPTYVITNHDLVRSFTRYGDGKNDDQIGKMMAAFYLTLRGTCVMYYGEEIGMRNNDPVTIEQVRDPIGKLGWPKEKGRDGGRTPMQWTPGKNAGFTTGTPWLPIPDSSAQVNVETESTNPNSVLAVYKRLLKLRKTEPALREGKWIPVNASDPNVLAYLREATGETVLVVLNMSAKTSEVKLELGELGKTGSKMELLLATGATVTSRPEGAIGMQAYGVVVGKVSK